MSYTHNNDIQEWKIAPINAILLTIPDLNGATPIRIENLLAISKANITSITRPTDTGGQRTVAYEFSGEFSLLQDDFETMNPLIKSISKNEQLTEFLIELKAVSGETNGKQINVMPDTSTTVNNYTITLDFVIINESPIVTLKIKGTLSIDAFDVLINYFFDDI